MIPSADEMRTTLNDRLKTLALSLDALRKAIITLGDIGYLDCSRHTVYFAKGVECVLRSYFSEIDAALTAKHCGGTRGKVELDFSLYTFSSRLYSVDAKRLTEGLRLKLLENEGVEQNLASIPEVLNHLDFDAMVSAYQDAVDACEAMGLAAVADFIYDVVLCERRDGIRFAAGRYNKSLMKTEYDFENRRNLHDLIFNLGVISKHTGFEFGPALGHLMSVNDISRLESRSSFGVKGGGLVITVFKSSFMASFSQAALDAIMAFVSVHCGRKGVAERLQSIMAMVA